MKTSRFFAGLGAVALVASSTVATAGTRAAEASAVSVQPGQFSAVTGDVTRSSAVANKKSHLGGDSDRSGLIIAVLAAAAVITGIILAVDDDDDDLSPGS